MKCTECNKRIEQEKSKFKPILDVDKLKKGDELFVWCYFDKKWNKGSEVWKVMEIIEDLIFIQQPNWRHQLVYSRDYFKKGFTIKH